MSLLKIENIEKRTDGALLFPSFSLTLDKKGVTAIYSSLNVRKVLLQMLMGNDSLGNGQITIQGIHALAGEKFNRRIAVFLLDEGVYERLTVKAYFKFFQSIYESSYSVKEMLQLTQLVTKQNIAIKNLTESERRRVHFGRVLFHDKAAVYIFEEPELNIDIETKRIFIHIVARLQEKDKGVVILTGNMESAITSAVNVYRLDENGLQKIETSTDIEEGKKEEVVESEEKDDTFQFHKVPTKVNDKIVLFDPLEIDYIESVDGQTLLHIKGETFPTNFTLNELENRLTHFGFFRCHRSYIVNLQKVREVITWTRNSFSLRLEDVSKSEIPLSKTKMGQLKGMLGL